MDYRELYQEATGRRLKPTAHVHHLDGNHENNKLSNLLAMPSTLHGRFHYLRSQLTDALKNYLDMMNYLDGRNPGGYDYSSMMAEYENVREEMHFWKCVKDSLLGSSFSFMGKADISMVYEDER